MFELDYKILVVEYLRCFLISFLTLFMVVKVLWNRRHRYRLSWQCDGPWWKPFIGNLFDFGSNGEALYNKLQRMPIDYQTPMRGWMGPFLCLVVTDPDDIQIVLKHENSMEKPFVYLYAKDWVGEGIITCPSVNVWRSHRKIIAPTFNRKILENYMPIFTKQSDVLVEQLQKFCGKNEEVEMFHYLSRCTLDIICESAMGVNINSQNGDEYGNRYIKATNRAFQLLFERTMKVWLFNDKIFRFSSLYKEFKQCTDTFHQLTDKIIHEKQDNVVDSTSQRNKTFVNELFHQASNDNSEWTDKEVRDEINSMIAAGADTTSHSMGFTILLLAMFPEVQEKVFKEIEYVDSLLDFEAEMNIENANKLKYMGQVINESLRLFSSSTIIGRYTTGDVQLKTRNLVIPKDVFVILGIGMMHRDTNVWGPDAHKFDPDNFLPENLEKRHPFCFAAFSGGPKNCVGLKFANLSMKMIIYKLLKAYRIETDEKFEDIRCEFHLLMKKVGGWKIKIHPRH